MPAPFLHARTTPLSAGRRHAGPGAVKTLSHRPRFSARAAAATSSSASMTTLSSCKLAISIYPAFAYDASGGGGGAVTTHPASEADLPPGVPPPPPTATALAFNPSTVTIPTLNWRTTRFLGLPLPPGLEIAVTPLALGGWVDRESGEAALAFRADFQFSAFGFYRPPIIPVQTLLVTSQAKGAQLTGTGRRLEGGTARLAGVARVPVLKDAFLSWFLRLPADCLAEMDARFDFK
jgi:hypothetical protein